MSNKYETGNVVRVSITFKNRVSKAFADPDSVFFTITDPNSVVYNYTYGVGNTIIRDETGKYHCDITVSIVGRWYYRFYSTGENAGSATGHFIVKENNFD